jgi:3-oxoacyl-[acyl-carrier protein] reductase
MATVTYNLAGKVAVVTGGAGGIGRAVALRLHESGARVALWDHNTDALTNAVKALSPETVGFAVDVTDARAVMTAAVAVADRFGGIDILINNAGILGQVGQLWTLDDAVFRRVLEVNLMGPFLCMRAVVPVMLRKPHAPDRGRIVNIASIQAKEGTPLAGAYGASKAALVALTKSLGKELATEGILVNAVTPSAVEDTSMMAAIDESRKADLLARIPMQRFVRTDEVAAQVLWLCSPECSFATGAVFDVSGGRATY